MFGGRFWARLWFATDVGKLGEFIMALNVTYHALSGAAAPRFEGGDVIGAWPLMIGKEVIAAGAMGAIRSVTSIARLAADATHRVEVGVSPSAGSTSMLLFVGLPEAVVVRAGERIGVAA